MPMRTRQPRIVVGIPTRSRPEILRDTLAAIATQSHSAERVLLCHTGPEDLPQDIADVAFTSILAPLARVSSATPYWQPWTVPTYFSSSMMTFFQLIAISKPLEQRSPRPPTALSPRVT